MKIVIVNKHRLDVIGGSEIQCDLIAECLSSRGHDVIYAVMSPTKASYDVPYRGVPVARPGLATWMHLLKRERPDVIYWRYNKKNILPALCVSRVLGIPFVFSISHIRDVRTWTYSGESPFARYLSGWHSSLPFPRRLFSLVRPRKLRYLFDPLRSALVKLSLRLFAAGYISNNDFGPLIPGPRKRIIRNSIIPDLIPFSWPRPFVVWVANIKPRKNPEFFMRLAEELRDTGVDFLMIGGIQSEEYRYIEESPARDNFFYLGKKSPSEVNGIIAASLFLVHTCNPEGFPNNLIQAWTQGKATVSLLFDPNGFIESHSLGLFSRDFDRLVTDVRGLIEDAETRGRLGNNAREFARKNFDPDNNVAQLESFLNDLLSITRKRTESQA